jgi:hypothetical protein
MLFVAGVALVLLGSTGNESRGGLSQDAPPKSISQFAVAAERMILAPKHIFVASGWITVQPGVKHLGTGRVIAPPVYAVPSEVTWKVDGKSVEVADYTWYPSEMILCGKPVSGLEVTGRVMPLAGVTAAVSEMTLRNPGEKHVSASVVLDVKGGAGYTDTWPYSCPRVRGKCPPPIVEKDRVVLRSSDERGEMAVSLVGGAIRDGEWKMDVTLGPGETRILRAVLALGSPDDAARMLKKVSAAPEQLMGKARANWERRIERLLAAAPVIETPNRELAEYYQRSLFTFLSCRWDGDAFVFRPWYATSGMDGGAVCAYLWDLSYTSKMATLCDPAAVRTYIPAYAKADLTKGHSLNPTDGRQRGAMYSYNYYSLTRLVYDYVAMTGDVGVLSEKVRDETVLDYLYRYALRVEDLSRPPVLVDYGTNRNLLELKRTNDYQHYTPSPNGERILIYRRLEELFSWAGRKLPVELSKRAEQFQKVFIEKLWDSEHRWFRCLDRAGQPRIAWSIQIFDLLRTGMLSREQAEAIVSHLNEREFLSSHGMHSLSKLDEGYDPNDADWGGPGVYSGDTPELVIDLIEAGFEKEGIDLLKRTLWWREFPYIPQAVLAASRDYRRNGRANVIAGLTGGQAILNGLLGMRVDGENVRFRPVKDPIVAGMRVSNLKIRGREFVVEVDAGGKTYAVQTGNRVERRRLGETIEIPLPAIGAESGRDADTKGRFSR